MSKPRSVGFVLRDASGYVAKASPHGIGCEFTNELNKALVFPTSRSLLCFVQKHCLRNQYDIEEVGKSGLVVLRTL